MENGDAPPIKTVEQMVAELNASEADVRAGRTVPLAPVLEHLQASIARMEAKQRDTAAE